MRLSREPGRHLTPIAEKPCVCSVDENLSHTLVICALVCVVFQLGVLKPHNLEVGSPLLPGETEAYVLGPRS